MKIHDIQIKLPLITWYTLEKGNTVIAISNLTVVDSIAKNKQTKKSIDQFIEIKLTKQWQSEITTLAL